ncbi:MAG: large conductance mechanosensitive channel protein MscL [Acidimicrobiia bacterium]|nr:large conductance mechanosensitive channel protein MscL [Acidimicrobiia bacterium]
MIRDFKAFLVRGNVVDLAVAVVIGTAFGAVVTAIVDGLITPLLGLFGDQDFSQYALTLKTNDDGTTIQLLWGAVLTAIIKFASVAAAIFFLVVKPLQLVVERRKRGEEPTDDTPAPSDEALLLTEIRDLLRAQG